MPDYEQCLCRCHVGGGSCPEKATCCGIGLCGICGLHWRGLAAHQRADHPEACRDRAKELEESDQEMEKEMEEGYRKYRELAEAYEKCIGLEEDPIRRNVLQSLAESLAEENK